jgi:CDP-diacylglycerol--serine O-phosphatidyltransferase
MALKHGGTKYGPYMDDIADFVSFGLAPAYVVIQKGGGVIPWIVGGFYIAGVAYRLIRFVRVDKKRTDLPEGVFSGFPSPAGALLVLGTALVAPPLELWTVTCFSIGIMVSRIRFAHFGRVVLKHIPRPVFFVISSGITVLLAYIFKTRNAPMFGYLILGSVFIYMVVCRRWIDS